MRDTVFSAAVLFLSVFLAVSAVYPADAGTAAADKVYITGVNAGVNGIYKNGLWMPVSVQWSCPLPEDIRNNQKVGDNISGSFRIVLSSVDSDGVPVEYCFDVFNPKIEKIENGKVYCRYECYAKSGRQGEAMKVSIQNSGTVLSEKIFVPSGNPAAVHNNTSHNNTLHNNTLHNNTLHNNTSGRSGVFFEPVPNERPVYLIIGNEDIGLQSAVAELSLREDRRPLIVKVHSVKDLPQQWFGYEAVDTVVITTTEPEQFAGLTSESPQIKALEQWLKLGGRVLFCAGKDSGGLLEKEDSPLRPFLPGKYEGMMELSKGTVLETFCESKRQIFMNGTNEAPYLKMPYISEPKGIVFLKERNLTLVSRCACGFGLIIYFGGDLSGRPLSVWKDRTTLVRNIMQWNTEKTAEFRSGSILQLGYSDISGQIRSALDKFNGVKIVPFSIILLILALYFLAVGPADWFLVNRILKRPVLTWITFPLWIILFASSVYFLGTAHRPNKAVFNELLLLDFDTETGAVRSSIWAGLYSPEDLFYSLSAEPMTGIRVIPYLLFTKESCFESADTLLSWNGLPGSGLGGMSPKTVSPQVCDTKSVQQFHNNHPAGHNNGSGTAGLAASSVCGVPVQIRSTKSFFSQRWHFNDDISNGNAAKLIPPFVSSPFVSTLSDEEGIPVGTLTLTSADLTPLTLENVILVYGRWVLELGNIESGTTVEVGKKTKRRELRDLLIPPDALDDQRLRQFAGYNMQSTDLDYIVRVFSFYSLLGGFDSTGLHHSFRHNLDMSEVFSADRAVVAASVKTTTDNSAAAVVADRDVVKNNRTVFRQILPIKLTELSPRLGHSGNGILNKNDPLADPEKTIGGQGSYGDPAKSGKDDVPKK